MKHETIREEIHSISPEDLELHPEALATPRMNSENYEALKRDIEMNGQIDPITVYRGKIIDGRHRWLIIQELGIDDKEIDMCGNNIVCLEDKIYRKKREIEQQNSYSYSGPGM